MTKIFLKDLTLKEIIKRLRKGEVIKNNYIGALLYVVNGEILSKDDKGIITICPYFEEEEPFEITETGVYRTRDGKRAYVYEVDESVYDKFPVCYILEKEGKPHSTTKQGRFIAGKESPYDIVAKWEDNR